jgi:hypothetical protein
MLSRPRRATVFHILIAEAEALDDVKQAAPSGERVPWVIRKDPGLRDQAVLFYRQYGISGEEGGRLRKCLDANVMR